MTPKAQSSKTFARSTLLPAGLALVGASLLLAGCAAMQRGPVGNQAVPQPAKAVELDRYLGPLV